MTIAKNCLPALALLLAVAAPAAEDLDERAAAAVARGLEALVNEQAEDGSIGNGAGITALAGMALLAGGHTPTRGHYRDASAKCLRFVLNSQNKLTGYLGEQFGNMYSHGFATLYLAECYGMSPDPRVRRALEAAIELIFNSQNREGGWRYQPVPLSADISITICQVMAIRAANNIGIGGERAQKVIAKAVGYVRRCATSNGTFTYTADRGSSWATEGAEAVPRTAAGSMCLIGAGINSLEDAVLGPSLDFLRRHFHLHLQGQGNWYWYGQYYASQAMFHSPEEKDWQRYWRKAVPAIVGYQGSDGLWNRPDSYGAAYASSMALIILQIPNNYLPIFQR